MLKLMSSLTSALALYTMAGMLLALGLKTHDPLIFIGPVVLFGFGIAYSVRAAIEDHKRPPQ